MSNTAVQATKKSAQLLMEARAYIRKHAPYYARLVYNMSVFWDTGVPTAQITEKLVGIINPQFWAGLKSTKMRASVLVHECHHIIHGYERFNALARIDLELARIATDIPINDALLACRGGDGPLWELPDFVVTSSKLKLPAGKTAETYFDLLRRITKRAERTRKHGDHDERITFFLINGVEVPATDTCGHSVGKTRNFVLDALDAMHGKIPGEVSRIRLGAIKDVQNHARQRGSFPGDLREVVQWDLTPKEPIVPWERFLGQAVRHSVGRLRGGRGDYSSRGMTKRSYITRALTPRLVSPDIDAVIIEDNSLSMAASMVAEGRNEVCNLLHSLGIRRVHYLSADTKVHSCVRVDTRQIQALPLYGRGGTSFIEPLETAKKLRPRPGLVVYITDGDGYAPPEPPQEFEVIWLIVPSPWQRIPAPWGTSIVMTNDPAQRRAYKFSHQEGGLLV